MVNLPMMNRKILIVYEELEQVSMTVEALQLWCEKMKIKAKEK